MNGYVRAYGVEAKCFHPMASHFVPLRKDPNYTLRVLLTVGRGGQEFVHCSRQEDIDTLLYDHRPRTLWFTFDKDIVDDKVNRLRAEWGNERDGTAYDFWDFAVYEFPVLRNHAHLAFSA